jgi:hypothetical protein
MLNKLRRYADIYNIAIVITNQVVSSPDASHPGFDNMKAAGGNIMGHGSTYRIFLKRSGKNRTAVMQDSSSHDNVYSDDQLARSTLNLLGDIINQCSDQTVVIYTQELIEDISLVELAEKARFSYLPLTLASKYGIA